MDEKDEKAARRERIIEAARQYAGSGITVRPDDVDAILAAGWDGIPIGAIVTEKGAMVVRKTGANEVTASTGQKITVTDAQKETLVTSYAVLAIIGPRR